MEWIIDLKSQIIHKTFKNILHYADEKSHFLDRKGRLTDVFT